MNILTLNYICYVILAMYMLDSYQEPSYNLSKNLLLLPRILKLIIDMVDDSTPLLILLNNVMQLNIWYIPGRNLSDKEGQRSGGLWWGIRTRASSWRNSGEKSWPRPSRCRHKNRLHGRAIERLRLQRWTLRLYSASSEFIL